MCDNTAHKDCGIQKPLTYEQIWGVPPQIQQSASIRLEVESPIDTGQGSICLDGPGCRALLCLNGM